MKELLRPLYLRRLYFPLFPHRKPPAFDLCWKYPDIAPDELESGSRPDVVFLPMTDWHVRIQRTQSLAREMARMGHRCFILNLNLGREFPDRTGGSVRLLRLEERIYEVHVRLRREPVFHHRRLRENEAREIAEAIRGFISDSAVVICSFPVWEPVARTLDLQMIYDCHDLLGGFLNVAPAVVALERDCIQRAMVTIASGAALLEHCRDLGAKPEKTVLLRNGFAPESGAGHQPPHSGRRRIGYLGALEDWFDAASVAMAADGNPEWDFVLAGRVESEKAGALRALPNVQFVGEIEHSQAGLFLSSLDAAIIPFETTPLTLAADPIKLYEYFAAGLPVVTSTLPETDRFAGLLHYYNGPEDFGEALKRALADDRREERVAAVRGETWVARAEILSGLVGLHAECRRLG